MKAKKRKLRHSQAKQRKLKRSKRKQNISYSKENNIADHLEEIRVV